MAVDKEVRQKKIEEKQTKEQKILQAAYEKSILSSFEVIDKLEGKPNVEFKKIQIELNLSDETFLKFAKHMKNELISQPDKGSPTIYINKPRSGLNSNQKIRKALSILK